jgi:hypothetical protein
MESITTGPRATVIIITIGIAFFFLSGQIVCNRGLAFDLPTRIFDLREAVPLPHINSY